ncbi:MAG: transketolase [Candidatus Marinimicrobia bacterium]|nr:transketolase [Candidatus Neomarinimicrobiota bacterium]
MNKLLRKKIVQTITTGGEGHIPSSFSIVDLIDVLYSKHLKFNSTNPTWAERDYFVLSKGHGCMALYVVLEKFGFITQSDLDQYGNFDGILGGHPDRTKVPGIEASTGSLGHGLPIAVGIALAHQIRQNENRVYVLVGDGECHEGTIWESALVAHNLKLNHLCCIVDYNGSAAQIMPHPNISDQWKSFGWNVLNIDGHTEDEIDKALCTFRSNQNDKPSVIIAKTVKGKGVSFLESHGIWHHKIPNQLEYNAIIEELDK